MTHARCDKPACYNQRNGSECWTVTHKDGSRSYEWPDEETARRVSEFASSEEVGPRHRESWC